MALSIPSGTYSIFNVAFNTVVDLTASNSAENTPIIGYSLDSPPQANQHWKLTNLPNTTIYTMQNARAGTFARARGDNLVAGGAVVGSKNNTPVSIESVGNNRFTIKVPNVNLAFALATGQIGAPVVLQQAGETTNQFWTFKSV